VTDGCFQSAASSGSEIVALAVRTQADGGTTDWNVEYQNRGASDDLNVGKLCAGSIYGVGDDRRSAGIITLIAHESHNLGAALLGIQNQPKNGPLVM
jgi:hypothetical protein